MVNQNGLEWTKVEQCGDGHKKIKVSTYIEPEDYEILKALADKEKRSVSSLLSLIVSVYLAEPNRVAITRLNSLNVDNPSVDNNVNAENSGKGGDEFVIKLANATRPSAIERAALAHKLNIPVERLDEIINRLFDKREVNNGT